MKIEEIVKQFGQKLFDINDGVHSKASVPYPENKELVLSISALSVLDDIPEYWQSFSAPTIKNRDIMVILSDPRISGSHYHKDSTKTVCCSEFIVSPNGEFIEKREPYSLDYSLDTEMHKIFKLEETIIQHTYDILMKGDLIWKKNL